MKHEEKCYQCKSVLKQIGCGTGYGIDEEGHKICYDCCGLNDLNLLRNMKIGEKVHLYLTVEDNRDNRMSYGEFYSGRATVCNWPNTYKKNVSVKKGSHNFAGVRYDAWFKEGNNYFHGVRYGVNSEICYVTCVKPF